MAEKKHDKRAGFSEVDRWRIFSLILFTVTVLLLAWQSDDAYHGYVMARNLAEGHGFVYNIGERSTASTGPLFTLIISLAYFFTREMFFTSLVVCTLLSSAAFYILVYKFCRSKEQILMVMLALFASPSFMSYTTSGLENSLLFLLSALFLWALSAHERYNFKQLFVIALIISAIAMARMDTVLIFAPAAVWIFIMKRDGISFPKAMLAAAAGLSLFVLWELFAVIYFGFPFPNPAYVKLGTGISQIEYLKRGILYYFYTFLNDTGVIMITVAGTVLSISAKKSKYTAVSLGIILYLIYILRIGGDFMMGRHFTVVFFISLCMFYIIENKEISEITKLRLNKRIFDVTVIACLVMTLGFSKVIGSQYLLGHKYSSHISDEREYYYSTTGLYNNVVSLVREGRLCVSDTWNNEAPDDLRENGLSGGIIDNAAGILVYYNPDLYLNDTYCLGDAFLSKLPAIYDPNWRVGHLRRAVPEGYRESVWNNDNEIEDPDLHEYYEVIRLITRGRIFDSERIKAIIDINTGKYDHLIDNYERRLEEK
ncbi:MAG: hypothetical protein J6O71_06100 [Lachnospiraceae bacterium]|nr:hypothetical protein [Lachnospiraceae bacterium]